MIYGFDEFLLNTATRELTCSDQPVDIEPQTFALLHALVENHDTVLTKDDLVDAVWQGRLTSDASITSRIKQARKAIGDDGRSQRYIKTLHGIGYRFVGTVTKRDAAVVVSNREAPSASDTAPSLDSRPMILVRTFEDSAGDSQDVLASGLTHDVISGLSRLRWLKVISWASVMRLQSDQEGLLRSLTRADYSLTGKLERYDSGVELALELTDLRDQSVIWAERVRAETGDVQALRAATIQQVVSTLELQISATEAAKAQIVSTSDLDAWSSYHLGMLHTYRFNEQDNARAIACFERAVKLQPGFARAHAGLSFALFHAVFNRYKGSDNPAIRRTALDSAERSVQLDGMDPMANFVMGRSFWIEGDVESSLPWLERALQINGNFAQAHYSHGLATVMLDTHVAATGDGHEAATSAINLSPLDPFMYGFYGLHSLAYLREGKLPEAKFWANRAARQPNAIPTMDFIAAAANSMAGDTDRAQAWAERARTRSGNADSSHFFQALPFYAGPLRESLEAAFQTLKLAPGA